MTTLTAEEVERTLRPIRPILRERAVELSKAGHEPAALVVGAVGSIVDKDAMCGHYWVALEDAPESERHLAFRVLYDVAVEIREERPSATARLVEMIETAGELYGLPGEQDEVED